MKLRISILMLVLMMPFASFAQMGSVGAAEIFEPALSFLSYARIFASCETKHKDLAGSTAQFLVHFDAKFPGFRSKSRIVESADGLILQAEKEEQQPHHLTKENCDEFMKTAAAALNTAEAKSF